jgi:hypothetical protein
MSTAFPRSLAAQHLCSLLPRKGGGMSLWKNLDEIETYVFHKKMCYFSLLTTLRIFVKLILS